MRRWLWAGMGFCFTLGCATVTKDVMPPSGDILPPAFQVVSEKDREKLDYFYLKLAETNPERHSQWWIKYRRAQLWKQENPTLSCEKFSELAKDPLFPLNSLAWMRAHEVCPEQSEILSQMGEANIEKVDGWLKPTAIEVLLAKAEREKNKAEIMKYSYEKSKFYLPTEEKVDLTRRSLEMASTLGDSNHKERMEERLHKLAPRLNPNPSKKEWLDVAKDFRRAREFDKARDYYQRVLNDNKSSLSMKISALHGIRYAWKNERNKEEYLKATENYARFFYNRYKKNKRSKYYREKLHDAYVELMRTYWTQGQIKNASNCLDFLERELKNKYSLAEVYWLRGRMAEEKQEFAESVKWFSLGLKERLQTRDLKEKLYWYQAWNLRKISKFAEAEEAFQELKKSADSDFAKARYQYWLARTIEDLERIDDAKAEYEELIKLDPLGYYGLLAHRQLHEQIPAGASPLLNEAAAKASFQPLSSPANEDIKDLASVPVLEWLLAVEETDLAKNYLDEISKGYNRKKDQSEETWLILFNYYARAGQYLGLYEQLGQLTAERRNKILEEHPELLFPRPYYSEVKLASERFDVNRELIYSIIRQESAFNPRARSHADAFGLMQMLPEVALKKAKALEIEMSKPEDLYDPYTNIHLGSAFVKELWDKYSGQFILAVSSYNASDKAIHGWMVTRYRGDSIEFIEDIPYEETRGYVRLVMRNFIFYRVIESQGQRISFPEELLRLNPVQASM